jgi:hypothetical protein
MSLDKRKFTLHLAVAANGSVFGKPLLIFKAQPEGYSKEDDNWTGDVSVAPGLSKSERERYDPRVDVIYSKKAWMGQQQSEYWVGKCCDLVEEGDFRLMQVDGYKSLLNAFEEVDKDGKFNLLVSPPDCTDLCSVIDSHLGVKVKNQVKKYFQSDFEENCDDWMNGKVSAMERRIRFTKWVADAVQKTLIDRPAAIVKAFQRCGVLIQTDGSDKEKVELPGMLTYKAPVQGEEHVVTPMEKAEVDVMLEREYDHRKKLKKEKQRQNLQDQKRINKEYDVSRF